MPLGLKIALAVLGALIALLIALVCVVLFLRVKIRIGFRYELYLKIYVGGVRVLSLPRPPKIRPLRTYTKQKAARAAAKKPMEIEDFVDILLRSPLYKMLKSGYRVRKSQKDVGRKIQAQKAAGQEDDELDIEVLLSLLAEILEVVLTGTRKGVRAKLERLHVCVVGDDAADTALCTAALTSVASYLLAVLDRVTHLSMRPGSVAVVPGFCEKKSKAELSLSLSCNLIRALGIIVPLLSIFDDEEI